MPRSREELRFLPSTREFSRTLLAEVGVGAFAQERSGWIHRQEQRPEIPRRLHNQMCLQQL